MGRYTTGAVTTREVKRIELSFLLKSGFIKQGRFISQVLTWTDGSDIRIESDFTCTLPYIRLIYQNTNNYSKEVTDHDYRIHFKLISSNLGKGKVLYFICPVSYSRCRILYKCYGSQIWKSRLAYQSRIYYQSQVGSKIGYYNNRYWVLEKQLEELYSRIVKSHYKGRKTALQRRIERLEHKQEYYDEMRWRIFKRSLSTSLL